MLTCCMRLIRRDVKRFKSMQQVLKNESHGFLDPKHSFKNIYLTKEYSSIEPKKDLGSIKSPYYPSHILAVVKNLQHFGFEEDETKLLLANQPELMNIPSNLWNDILESFHNFGFEKEDISLVLERNPKVLMMNKKMLCQNLHAWSNCGFERHLLLQVLTENPTFLQVHHVHVSRRVKQYQLHFESKNRAAKLLLLAPNALEESWPILQEKLNYLDSLCTEKSDVVASGVLAYSAFHIKARHEFLIRAGLYKRPQKDFHKRLSKNPKLSTIVNTTDEQFVLKSGLSMFEYEVFLEMYKKEVADEADYDSDSDSDIDYSNNN